MGYVARSANCFTGEAESLVLVRNVSSRFYFAATISASILPGYAQEKEIPPSITAT